MRSPTLPVQVEEELQRVARKRSATADVACRELLEPLSHAQSLRALSEAGNALELKLERALQQVCDKKGVKADDSCVEQLAALAPEDALEVLRAIGSTGTAIRSLSPYTAAVIKSKFGVGGGTPEKDRTPKRAGGEATTPPNYDPASSWSQPLSPPAHRFESDEHVHVSPCASPSQAHVKEARIPLP